MNIPYINANMTGVFVDGIHGAPYMAAPWILSGWLWQSGTKGETGSNWAYYFPMLSQLCHCRECLFVTTLHNDMLSLKTSNTYLITVSFFPPELWQCIAMHSIRWFLLVRAFPVWNSFLFCIFLTSRPAHLGSTLCHSVSLGAALLQNLDSCACKIE